MVEAHLTAARAPLWGVSAEFESADAMLAALTLLQRHELGRLDAYSPIPVPEAARALRLGASRIPALAFAGAVIGGAAMMAMCAYATIWSYPLNIGGRPAFSWPAFVVPTFSFAMLAGTLSVVFMLMLLNRLPRLNHPAFNIPGFGRVTSDRFFVAVEARDDRFDPARVERVLAALSPPPCRVSRVPR